MSVETLIENLQEIRVDALDMIKNIESVRGKKYALMVHSLLVARQLADIQNMAIAAAASESPEQVMESIQDAMATCITQLLANTGRAGGINAEELQEAMDQSEKMGDKFEGLIKMAIHSDRHGSAFGGKDAG